MLIPKEAFFDRFDQSFSLFKNNFLGLFLPIFIYNFLSVIVGVIISTYFFSNLGEINPDSSDFFSILNDPYIVFAITTGVFLFILYLMLYIPVFLGLIKSIKQAYNEEKITTKQNILYGFTRFFDSMKTYWYIFAYVALIPAIIFIIGGIMLNIGLYFEGYESFKKIGGIIMIISVLLFIIFAIYRGTKATFAMYSAVDGNSFVKSNFIYSLNITINNWWRILGNVVLLGILISVITGLIGSIIGIFTFVLKSGGMDYGLIFNQIQSQSFDIEKTKEMLINAFSNKSLILDILKKTIDNIITTAGAVYVIIFTYILFKRLELEPDIELKQESSNKIEDKALEL